MSDVVDIALVNGRVRTQPDRARYAEAVGLAGSTIAVVGSTRQVQERVGPSTEVIDLEGSTVISGLVDSHLHPFMGVPLVRGADLAGARTLDEVRRRLAEERACGGAEGWVLGYGLDYNAFAASGIHGDLLVEATGGAPALITFADLHTALATPRALELAGIDGPRHFEQHAEIVVDADGTPTGELREPGATDLARAAVPALSEDEFHGLAVRQLRRFNAAGLTGAHGMDGDFATFELLARLERQGDLSMRLRMPFWVRPDTPRDHWAEMAAARDRRGVLWSGGVAKFFIDGVIDSGTAWLVEPDSEGQGTEPLWPDVDRYREAVAFFAAKGFQCVTHACGDRAVREALDAYRAAGAAPGVRHRVEHIETIQPEDLPRFAAEGVVASMQTQHMMTMPADHDDNWNRRLGPDRTARAFLTRALWDSGALVTLGSDWPVADFDPRIGMASARLRRTPGETERLPYDDQSLTAAEALEGYTRSPARVAGVADRQGEIRAGWCADLTVLACDPAECPADELPTVPVELTIVDGRVVHRSAA